MVKIYLDSQGEGERGDMVEDLEDEGLNRVGFCANDPGVLTRRTTRQV